VAGIVLAIAAGGIGGAWALGWRPFGDAESSDDDGSGGGSPRGAGGTVDDTTAFGPIGFNAVTDSPGIRLPGAPRPPDIQVGGPDSVPSPVLPASAPARARATVVVPPGHAISGEIVVIPGLPVLSVAETRAGGAPGHRVVQEAEGGVEVRLVATPGDFGADTVGLGVVLVETEGDSIAAGTVRLGRYLVDARAAMSAETLAAYLRQLILARPVN
jgi:hypothetical protein